MTNEEVFANCGAYNGDTIKSFLKNTNGDYKTIFALEPDETIHKIV